MSKDVLGAEAGPVATCFPLRFLAAPHAKLEQRLAGLRADLIKWMFAFWVGNFATTAGLVFALAHFLRT